MGLIPSHKILSCPYFSIRLHGIRPEEHWIREWARKDSGSRYCHMNYMWMANYKFPVQRYLHGELPWPESWHESPPARALITYRINLLIGSRLGQFEGHAYVYDLPGIRRIEEPDLKLAGLVENPVGFADGHVIIRSPKEILSRVFVGITPGLLHY